MELIKDGKRIDGRAPDELRPIKIEAGPLYRADGRPFPATYKIRPRQL